MVASSDEMVAEKRPAPASVANEGDEKKPRMEENKLKAQGYVPIKTRFLVPTSEAPVLNVAAAKKQSSGQNRTGKSRKQLKREREEMMKSKGTICNSIARTGKCKFGDDCKFNHDVQAFLAQKPADLPGECLYVSHTGECPFGVSCRFYGSHDAVAARRGQASPPPTVAAAPELEKLDREALLALRLPIPVPEALNAELNVLDKDLQAKLRRRQVAFPRSDEALSRMGVKSSKHYARLGEGKKSNFQVERGDNEVARRTPRERKEVDFRNKLYLSPLTTVGNLPYRRICKTFGADITCGEMALATNILQGQASEWALLKRHASEDFFGVQIAGGYADSVTRAAELISREMDVDFIDVNMGCPIDLLCNKGGGAALMKKPNRIKAIAQCASPVIDVPLTLKMRKGYYDGKDICHEFVQEISGWGARALTLHGRTREQRYTKCADWDYIERCAKLAGDLPVIGNGDIFNFEEYNAHVAGGNVSTVMIGRAALIKPWIFQEIKEQRHIDISATERLDMLKFYCANGLEHWGSDSKGVETTRRYMLEWLSFLHRYVPVGLLEVLPQSLGMSPPAYYGRTDLETLLASSKVDDWIKISEMLLGPTPANFSFVPKHRSYSYKVLSVDERGDKAENG